MEVGESMEGVIKTDSSERVLVLRIPQVVSSLTTRASIYGAITVCARYRSALYRLFNNILNIKFLESVSSILYCY